MMATADRLMFVASVLQEGDVTYAERHNLCAEISRIADTVRAMEQSLDSIVASAQDEDALLRSRMKVIPMRPWKLRKPKLRAIPGGRAEFGI